MRVEKLSLPRMVDNMTVWRPSIQFHEINTGKYQLYYRFISWCVFANIIPMLIIISLLIITFKVIQRSRSFDSLQSGDKQVIKIHKRTGRNKRPEWKIP